jgi:hypothetical protein
VRHGKGTVSLARASQRSEKSLISLVPRPGVEPGLEVPETSVMSFSLPGRAGRQKDYIRLGDRTSNARDMAAIRGRDRSHEHDSRVKAGSVSCAITINDDS